MKRILIVGISGTGKTRLANELSDKLGIPVIHLDAIFWKENWQEENPDVVEAKIRDALNQDSWITEGYIEPLGRERVQAADLVLHLDYPGYLAFWGGLQRWWQFRGRTRPEMPQGNIESLGWKFLLTLLRRDERPEIKRAIKNRAHKVVRLKSRRQAYEYVERLAE